MTLDTSRTRVSVTAALPRSDAQFLARVEADALAYGGDELVAEVRAEASAWALAHDDPVRWSAFLGVAWQLVDARRAELVGTLVPDAQGGVRTVTPARCPAGHVWDDPRVSRWVASWMSCRAPGHRGHHRWLCVVDVDGAECRGEVIYPDPAEGCSFVGIGDG